METIAYPPRSPSGKQIVVYAGVIFAEPGSTVELIRSFREQAPDVHWQIFFDGMIAKIEKELAMPQEFLTVPDDDPPPPVLRRIK